MAENPHRQPVRLGSDTLLVTGGGGFVLSHLVRQWLEADGSNRAVVVDLSPLDETAQRWFDGVQDRIRFVQGSVSDSEMWASLDAGEVTHICHAAAVTSINRLFEKGFSNALPALETNTLGAGRALAFASECKNLKRMVHVSTGSVYGTDGPENPDESLPEDGYIDPDGFYGITKFAGEQLAVQSARQLGLPVVAIRLSSIYGPMDRRTAYRDVALPPNVLMSCALEGRPARVTDLGGSYDCLQAGDVAAAIRALFDAVDLRYTVYNVASGERKSMGGLIDAVAEVMPGLTAEIVPAAQADIVVEPEKRDGRWNAYDISRIAADTTWKPRPLAVGLAEYRDWLRAGR